MAQSHITVSDHWLNGEYVHPLTSNVSECVGHLSEYMCSSDQALE